MSGMKDMLGDTLFDTIERRPTAAQAAKRAGMDQVEAHADPLWSEAMYACVVTIAQLMKIFTADDVFDLADKRGCATGTHDLRAFGPVMMRAARAGLCRKADRAPVPSRRASLHASPRAVWESLIYKGTQAA